MAKLTAKQQRFCDEYLTDLNATQAAIRAGYSQKTAGVIASENLKKPNIQEYIKKRMDEKEKALLAGIYTKTHGREGRCPDCQAG